MDRHSKGASLTRKQARLQQEQDRLQQMQPTSGRHRRRRQTYADMARAVLEALRGY